MSINGAINTARQNFNLDAVKVQSEVSKLSEKSNDLESKLDRFQKNSVKPEVHQGLGAMIGKAIGVATGAISALARSAVGSIKDAVSALSNRLSSLVSSGKAPAKDIANYSFAPSSKEIGGGSKAAQSPRMGEAKAPAAKNNSNSLSGQSQKLVDNAERHLAAVRLLKEKYRN